MSFFDFADVRDAVEKNPAYDAVLSQSQYNMRNKFENAGYPQNFIKSIPNLPRSGSQMRIPGEKVDRLEYFYPENKNPGFRTGKFSQKGNSQPAAPLNLFPGGPQEQGLPLKKSKPSKRSENYVPPLTRLERVTEQASASSEYGPLPFVPYVPPRPRARRAQAPPSPRASQQTTVSRATGVKKQPTQAAASSGPTSRRYPTFGNVLQTRRATQATQATSAAPGATSVVSPGKMEQEAYRRGIQQYNYGRDNLNQYDYGTDDIDQYDYYGQSNGYGQRRNSRGALNYQRGTGLQNFGYDDQYDYYANRRKSSGNVRGYNNRGQYSNRNQF